MRLSGSFGTGCSPEELCGDVRMTEQAGNEYWSKCLTDGANELAVSIQNSIQSKQLESTSDSGAENSMDHGEQADAKRMETVLIYAFLQVDGAISTFFISRLCLPFFVSLQIFHFMIASLKSGRSSVLLDIIIELLYPVLSLQVKNLVTCSSVRIFLSCFYMSSSIYYFLQ